MTTLLLLAQAAVPLLDRAATRHGLTIGGWITMLLSVGFVTILLAWCVWKVLREPDAEHRVHSTLDEPPDAR